MCFTESFNPLVGLLFEVIYLVFGDAGPADGPRDVLLVLTKNFQELSRPSLYIILHEQPLLVFLTSAHSREVHVSLKLGCLRFFKFLQLSTFDPTSASLKDNLVPFDFIASKTDNYPIGDSRNF